ncbi:Nnf1-domain-containing protein [Tothia fuscella]|uniref:Nnf1-domain-containing protein n=1 Tax=Tothia fuscella TaxID=1048955 RepID=A0A9P4U3Y0_9PEZI|nr:Nnf1-domain-containing protein [Tothia fuscella]
MTTTEAPPRSHSRSQSPLPPAPEENTPGHRATAFQNALNAALDATLKKCSYDNFASCFPTTAKYQPETLEGFWKDFTGKLSSTCQAEFNDILENRNVVPSLNALDRLIAEAKGRKDEAEKAAGAGGAVTAPVPPHILPASDILNAHLTPFLVEQQTSLSSALTALQSSNTTLIDTVISQRAEMEALVSGLESVVADLERGATMLQGDEVLTLAGESRKMEDELKSVTA